VNSIATEEFAVQHRTRRQTAISMLSARLGGAGPHRLDVDHGWHRKAADDLHRSEQRPTELLNLRELAAVRYGSSGIQITVGNFVDDGGENE